MRRLFIIFSIAALHFGVALGVTIQAAFAGDLDGEVPLTSFEKTLNVIAAILNFPFGWIWWRGSFVGLWSMVSLPLNSLFWGTGIYYLWVFFFRRKKNLKAA
ncbi:MAG: hypothetical protein V7641_4168 [Blastocatellia bacterium]